MKPHIRVFDRMSYCYGCAGQNGTSTVTYFVDYVNQYEPIKLIAYVCTCGYAYRIRTYDAYIARAQADPRRPQPQMPILCQQQRMDI